jgi:hypothetical protein
MKSVSWRSLAELVAVVGVIFSLVFVGLELRQTRIASKAAAYQELGLAVSDIWLSLSRNRELSDLLGAVDSIDSYNSLDRSDQLLIQNFMVGVLRQFETTYLQVEEGLLDASSLRLLGWEQLKDNNGALQATWPEIHGWITSSFASYLVESGYVQFLVQ